MLFTVLFVLEVQPQSPTAAKLKSVAGGKDVVVLLLLVLVVLAEPFQMLLLLPYAGYFSLVISMVIERIAAISRKIAAAATATKVEEYNIFLSLFNFLDH